MDCLADNRDERNIRVKKKYLRIKQTPDSLAWSIMHRCDLLINFK